MPFVHPTPVRLTGHHGQGLSAVKELLCSLLRVTGAVISCLCLTFPHRVAWLFHSPIEAKDAGSTFPPP